MKCPYCGEVDTQVIETRASDDGGSIRRRRRCAGCDKRFTTFERAELRMPLIVKKNGEREEFDSEKLRRSLTLALRKRPVEMAAVETAITRMEEQLLGLAEREVASDALGNMVMDALRRLDHVAYVRFASVYRNFADVDEFSRAVREVSPGRRRR